MSLKILYQESIILEFPHGQAPPFEQLVIMIKDKCSEWLLGEGHKNFYLKLDA